MKYCQKCVKFVKCNAYCNIYKCILVNIYYAMFSTKKCYATDVIFLYLYMSLRLTLRLKKPLQPLHA